MMFCLESMTRSQGSRGREKSSYIPHSVNINIIHFDFKHLKHKNKYIYNSNYKIYLQKYSLKKATKHLQINPEKITAYV